MATNADLPGITFRSNDRRSLQEQLRRSEQSGATDLEEARVLTRNGEQLFLLGDWDLRHDRRVQRALQLGKRDSLFWATISIACGEPTPISTLSDGPRALRPKRLGSLAKARHDLDAIYQYYRPLQIGDPEFVGFFGVGKAPGFFDCAAWMDNPTTSQVKASTRLVADWLEESQSDPEYSSFQLNFFFSGHGLNEGGQPEIVLADQRLPAVALVDMLLACVPQDEIVPSQARLDLYLDCCHSAAVAEAIAKELRDRQQALDPSEHSRLDVGQVYCAALDDEESFEYPHLSHSIFTFAFLNECSRKRLEGVEGENLALRDIGWRTDGKQHPLLLDFTTEGVSFKYPAMYYLSREGKYSLDFTFDQTRLDNNPIGEYLRLAHQIREGCVPIERTELRDPDNRIPFSRDEVITNEKFPFL